MPAMNRGTQGASHSYRANMNSVKIRNTSAFLPNCFYMQGRTEMMSSSSPGVSHSNNGSCIGQACWTSLVNKSDLTCMPPGPKPQENWLWDAICRRNCLLKLLGSSTQAWLAYSFPSLIKKDFFFPSWLKLCLLWRGWSRLLELPRFRSADPGGGRI